MRGWTTSDVKKVKNLKTFRSKTLNKIEVLVIT